MVGLGGNGPLSELPARTGGSEEAIVRTCDKRFASRCEAAMEGKLEEMIDGSPASSLTQEKAWCYIARSICGQSRRKDGSRVRPS